MKSLVSKKSVNNTLPKESQTCSGIEPTTSWEKKKEQLKNLPIRQDLRSVLTSNHPEFDKRDISKETCKYLGCGYWQSEKSKSPLANRIIFQVRGIEENENGELSPVILSHLGCATDEEQEKESSKWNQYQGFHKNLELYNIDNLLLDERAVEQAKESGKVIIVEGLFDVAKMVESGIYNVVSSFGSHLSENQLQRLELIIRKLEINKILVWYDRDDAGKAGQEQAIELLKKSSYQAEGFDWEKDFISCIRRKVKIPPGINDVGDFNINQLAWLRERKII